MTFNLKITLDQDYLDEYYGNLPEMFGEMLKEEIEKNLRALIKEELRADNLRLAVEVRKVIKQLSLQMNDTEIADLAYAIVDSTVKGKK